MPDLRRYFAAQLLAIMVEELTLGKFSENSPVYAAAFIIGDLIVFATMVPLVWESLSKHTKRWAAIAAGLVMAMMLSGVAIWRQDMTAYKWIGTGDGVYLVLCAVCCGLGAAFLSGMSQRIALSLMALWFAQSLYEFGFTLHIESPGWITANEFLPAVIVASGCLWLALFCTAKETA